MDIQNYNDYSVNDLLNSLQNEMIDAIKINVRTKFSNVANYICDIIDAGMAHDDDRVEELRDLVQNEMSELQKFLEGGV